MAYNKKTSWEGQGKKDILLKKTILSPDKQKNRAESIERFSRLQITPGTLLPVKEISTIFSFIFHEGFVITDRRKESVRRIKDYHSKKKQYSRPTNRKTGQRVLNALVDCKLHQ